MAEGEDVKEPQAVEDNPGVIGDYGKAGETDPVVLANAVAEREEYLDKKRDADKQKEIDVQKWNEALAKAAELKKSKNQLHLSPKKTPVKVEVEGLEMMQVNGERNFAGQAFLKTHYLLRHPWSLWTLVMLWFITLALSFIYYLWPELNYSYWIQTGLGFAAALFYVVFTFISWWQHKAQWWFLADVIVSSAMLGLFVWFAINYNGTIGQQEQIGGGCFLGLLLCFFIIWTLRVTDIEGQHELPKASSAGRDKAATAPETVHLIQQGSSIDTKDTFDSTV
jgi:hypothetical protein